jgi:hypothetical protein
MEALRRRVGDTTRIELARQLSAAVGRQPPFTRQMVDEFLKDNVTTDVLMAAFLELYRDLPPPVFWAESYEEAHRHHQIAMDYQKPRVSSSAKLTETIEDTGEERVALPPQKKQPQRR